jgi:succinate dehydrogenase/fumarate reductase flavoprotein subunit
VDFVVKRYFYFLNDQGGLAAFISKAVVVALGGSGGFEGDQLKNKCKAF